MDDFVTSVFPFLACLCQIVQLYVAPKHTTKVCTVSQTSNVYTFQVYNSVFSSTYCRTLRFGLLTSMFHLVAFNFHPFKTSTIALIAAREIYFYDFILMGFFNLNFILTFTLNYFEIIYNIIIKFNCSIYIIKEIKNCSISNTNNRKNTSLHYSTTLDTRFDSQTTIIQQCSELLW